MTKKKTNTQQHARAELADKGVALACDLAANWWLRQAEVNRLDEWQGAEPANLLAGRYLDDFLKEAESFLERYPGNEIPFSGDDICLSRALQARDDLLVSLKRGDAERATFSALMLSLNMLGLGEWHRYWLYSDFAASEHSRRANAERHKGLDDIRDKFQDAARSRWKREREDGAVTTTAGEMARLILSANASYLNELIKKGRIARQPAATTVKKWFIESGLVPVEVAGKRGRPRKK